jgi:hypothetical protein
LNLGVDGGGPECFPELLIDDVSGPTSMTTVSVSSLHLVRVRCFKKVIHPILIRSKSNLNPLLLLVVGT